jgi:proteasome-associated ATPase
MASPDESTADLDAQVASLREEIEHLRGRLSEAPRRTRSLEERLLETKGQLAQAVGRCVTKSTS